MNSNKPSEAHDTDEFKDIFDVVMASSILADSLSINPRLIRSVFLEIFSAFVVTMICVLERSDGGGIWRNSDEARLLKRQDEPNIAYPEGMVVASPKVLWCRCKSDEWMKNWGGRPINSSQSRDNLVAFSIDIRNDMQHFSPKGWSIHGNSLTRAVTELCSIISELSHHPSFREVKIERREIDTLRIELEHIKTKVDGLYPDA
ncbi:hypothetical protein [Acuticoccus kandeliae]|uniref:hypothetical protein n=1 Tax=Acuticoccus kandeliae TaxID=2073160 RepID=UPI00130059F4|nr:hypothetical protein [Acuticoccus kandeliae]